MQQDDARRVEAWPWTRLVSDDRLTWTITEAASSTNKPPTGASCLSTSSAGGCSCPGSPCCASWSATRRRPSQLA